MFAPYGAAKPKFYFWTTLAGILGLLLVALLFGWIRRDLNGEEFATYHFANSFSHFVAWKSYFFEVGRPLAVAYWIYSYELFGYQPVILHTQTILLVILSSSLATVLFWRAWPRDIAHPATPALLLLLFVFSWVSVDRFTIVSSDQTYLSLVFFFAAGLCIQNAVANRSRYWVYLATSLVFFLASMLTYEAVAFVFPSLLFLAWPLLPAERRNLKKTIGLFALYTGASVLVVFASFALYAVLPTQRQSIADSSISEMAGKILKIPSFLASTGDWLMGLPDGFSKLPAIVFVLSLLVALVFFLSQFWQDEHPRSEKLQQIRAIYLASICLVVFGLLPFVFAGYGTGASRVSHASILGVPALLVLNFQMARGPGLRLLNGLLLALTLLFGFLHLPANVQYFQEKDKQLVRFTHNLLDVVPQVRSDTTFIFLDYPMSNSGCGPMLNMLYGRELLHCAYLSSSLRDYWAIRYAHFLQANRGGNLRDENWIIIAVDDNGHPYIVPELRRGDFGLKIYWITTKPIRTDLRRLNTFDETQSSEMMNYIFRRYEELFP